MGGGASFGYGESKSNSQSGPAKTAQINAMMDAYVQNLPKLVNVIGEQAPGLAEQLLAATQAVSQPYNQLGLEQMQKYAMPYAQVGQNVLDSNALAGARTNLSQIQGPGGQAAVAAGQLTDQLNPQIAAARQRSMDLLGSINLGGLTGSERAEVERAGNQQSAQTGQLGVGGATNALANMANFGSALQAKQTLLGQALNVVNNTTATNLGAFNPVQTALGQPAITAGTNFGTGQFTPTQQNVGQAGVSLGQALFGGVTGLGQSTGSSHAFNINGSGQAGSSGGCCFILLEALNGQLPPHVRVCRDAFYSLDQQLATGYKRMARWLVPSMQHSRLVKWLVNKTMVQPIIRHGGYLMGVDVYNRLDHKIRKIWFAVWKQLGK